MGFALAVIGVPVVALGLGIPIGEASLPNVILLMLALVTAVAFVGGMWPALLAAVGGSLMVNFYYTEPRRSLAVADPRNVLSLIVFVVVAVSVSLVVSLAAKRT